MTTILVVDDMAICREPIAEALRRSGYHTICAADGEEALSTMREQLPDLVVLDLGLPGLDGLTVLQMMRRDPCLRRIPVVLLTDQAERSIVARAAESGAQGYLLKSSFSLEKLFAMVDRALGKGCAASVGGAVGHRTEGSERYGSWRSTIEVGTPSRQHLVPADAPIQQDCPSSDAKAVATGSMLPAARRSLNDLEPVIAKSDLIALVNEGLALRPLGPTVSEVIAVTGSAGCCADDVAKAVSHDQALCIRLLKLANSSAYSRGRLVDGLKDAIQRIGVQEVRALVMTLGVFDQFEGAAAEHVNPHLFWEHSIACGLAASALAKARQAKNVDDYFLWGMLHDVGRLILLEHASDQYATVWEAAEELHMPLEAIESRVMLLDHCDVLERALEHWRFSRDFIAPVVNHHRSAATIKRLGPDHTDRAATVALANRIAHALLIGSGGNEVIYPFDDLVEALDLPVSRIAGIAATIPDETNSLKYTMLARANTEGSVDFRGQVASAINAELRPLCVSAVPEADAFRIFCERICSSINEGIPNLGIMYVRDASELKRLTTPFDAEERSARTSKLPVLLIVGRGKLDPSQSWLAARRHAVLTAPVRISDFVSTVNRLLEG